MVGTGRNESALKELKNQGHILDYIVADITVEGAAHGIVEKAIDLLDGTLTSLVNCAGVLKGGAMGDETVDLSNYQMNMNTNVQAPFELMLHAIPFLKKAESASIVNISSVNAKQSFPGCVTYCMSKAALDQLTKCSSVDLAKFGIRVNSVNPGVIETNLQRVSSMELNKYLSFTNFPHLSRSILNFHLFSHHHLSSISIW